MPNSVKLRKATPDEDQLLEDMERALEDTLDARDEVFTSLAQEGADYITDDLSTIASPSSGEIAFLQDPEKAGFYEYDGSEWAVLVEIGAKVFHAVDTLADLKSLEPDPRYIALVRGYDSTSDQGALFWWDASGDATAADDETTVVSTVSGYTDGDANEGVWRRQIFDLEKLPDYGGGQLAGDEVLGAYVTAEGEVQGLTLSQLLKNAPGPAQIIGGSNNSSDVDSRGTVQLVKFGDPPMLQWTGFGSNCQLIAQGRGDFGSQIKLEMRRPDGGTMQAVLIDSDEAAFNTTVSAPTKNFVIDHPSKDEYILRHGSLEGGENGVYQRGTLDGSAVIDLPGYWEHLVDGATITLNLTAIGSFQKLYVKSKSVDQIELGIEGGATEDIHCDYTVYAERADVESLVVEEEKETTSQ
jgi:hypothetical protein